MVKHDDHQGISISCLLIELGQICNFMVGLHCDLKFVRTTVYLKAIMEVYGKKTFIGMGPTTVLKYLPVGTFNICRLSLVTNCAP